AANSAVVGGCKDDAIRAIAERLGPGRVGADEIADDFAVGRSIELDSLATVAGNDVPLDYVTRGVAVSEDSDAAIAFDNVPRGIDINVVADDGDVGGPEFVDSRPADPVDSQTLDGSVRPRDAQAIRARPSQGAV